MQGDARCNAEHLGRNMGASTMSASSSEEKLLKTSDIWEIVILHRHEAVLADG